MTRKLIIVTQNSEIQTRVLIIWLCFWQKLTEQRERWDIRGYCYVVSYMVGVMNRERESVVDRSGESLSDMFGENRDWTI